MFGFFRWGFGRGGNTLILLGFFLTVGIFLHFKDRFFPSGRLWEVVSGIASGSISEKAGLWSVLPEPPGAGAETGGIPAEPGKEAALEEVLKRSDFVFPAPGKAKLELVRHQGFALGYNERYEQAAWVAYPLLREQVIGQSARERFFNPDPKVSTGSALFSDYTRSGFDRGHLAPAADFKHSLDQMRETFFMSNISPQNRDFNAGIWNDLEKLVRAWANRYEKIFVVTGPVLRPGLSSIGKVNRVAVPEKFYKVILFAEPPHVKGIAFLLDNQPASMPLSKAVVSIDSVETITGLDFFPMLPDDVSRRIESVSNPKDWFRLK
ncbi:hypothetical protein GCM10023091_39540 [Ravibacter arvi]|uniref:Endonuclease n=1 Tax=Ravibacter arvi TaxID=2051041 RepID=A0ABP8MBV9_9BACT